jgi:FkbM family methyltransferase
MKIPDGPKMMRQYLKRVVNATLSCAGLRLVSSQWGPRGFLAAFEKLAVAGFAPGEIIDVGAAQGLWTEECMQLFPNATYLLVDPLPSNAEALSSLAKAKKGRMKVWHGAIGATNGTLEIYDHGDQSSSYLAADRSLTGARTLSVPMRSLDSFLEDHTICRPAILKADVQGAELEVIKGASATLSIVQAVLLELSFRRIYHGIPLAAEVIAAMAQHGFRIADICSYSQRSRDGALLQSDMLFVKEGLWPVDDETYF